MHDLNTTPDIASYEGLLHLLKSRRSIRRFRPEPVKRETLLRVLEAARWAPSNHNRQPWKLMVLDEKGIIATLAERVRECLKEKLKSLPSIASGYAEEMLGYATFFGKAPLVIVCWHKRPISASAGLLEGLSNPSLISGEPLSVAMAVQNILLAAHTLGLGTCVLTGPLLVEQAVVQAFPAGPGYDLTCLIAMGYAAEAPETPRRKALEQVIEFRHEIR